MYVEGVEERQKEGRGSKMSNPGRLIGISSRGKLQRPGGQGFAMTTLTGHC